ncbi:MAG TPA: hypothetical protein VGF06_13125, partial [Terriglobales bacterium]
MATVAANPTTTRDKLLRAREASAQLARLSTAEKNSILLAMAEALAANEPRILAANQKDLDASGLQG